MTPARLFRILAHLVAAAAVSVLVGCAGLPALTSPVSEAAVFTDTSLVLSAPAAASGPVAAVQPTPVDTAAAPLTEPLSITSDLWLRVRQGMSLADLDDPLVAKWEAYYAARPAYVARMMERGGRYLFHIVEEVQARGLPMELALLPFIESAFNPQARSSAAAEGMWQFVPATGRAFDLRQNLLRDDRRDVIASTRAALAYLTSLHQRFDDWHLALAAYNWGQGNVSRAIKRNSERGRPADYSALRMPEETRNYVPKLLAMKRIVQQPAAYGLTLPALEDHPAFVAVPIERDIDVALAARLAGLKEDEFRAYNPQHAKPVILAAGTSEVLLPYHAAERFGDALKTHAGPLASWTVWVAPRTMTAAQAATLVGANEAELRKINRIPAKMQLRAGSAIVVPRQGKHQQDVAEHLAENASIALVPEEAKLRRVVHKVDQRGDSVAGIARRYRVKAVDVARWNQVGVKDRFRAGDKVTLMLPRTARSTRQAGGHATPTKPVTRRAKSPR